METLQRQGVRLLRFGVASLVVSIALALPLQVVAVTTDPVPVRLDGEVLFRVGPGSGVDASSRAEAIERRLRTLLDRPGAIAPAAVESGPGPDERTIRVAGARVLTVSAADAEEELTTVDELAGTWAAAIDEALQRGLTLRDSPLERFVTEVRVSVTTAFSRLGESAITTLPRLLAAMLVLAFFWLLATIVRRGLRAVFRRVITDLTIENLLKQLAYYAVWVVGMILAADALGFTPETVIAGLGLTGLALGFALKDVLSNFVSGLLILALRPFRIGDEIRIGDAEGRVERIDLRATNIRTYDGRLVVVPNAELLTSRVVNNTASPVRRAVVTVTVDHGTDIRDVGQVVAAATQRVAGVLTEPPVAVRLGELTSEGIAIEARFWTDSRRSDFMATVSTVRAEVLEGLRAASIELARPELLQLEAMDWRVGDGRPAAHGPMPARGVPREDGRTERPGR